MFTFNDYVDRPVVPHKGKYSTENSLAAMSSECAALLETAYNMLLDLQNPTDFEKKQIARFGNKLNTFKAKRHHFFYNGEDFLFGL